MVAVDKRRKQVAESDVELLMNIAGEEGTIPNQNEPEEIMSESIGPEHATTQQEGQVTQEQKSTTVRDKATACDIVE